MRTLITGGVGFVGPHLASHLVKCGDDVAVTYLYTEKDPPVPLPKATQTIALDITKKDEVDQVIKLLQPDAVYHLAARTFVPTSEQDPKDVFDVNVFGLMNLLDAVAKYSPASRVLYVSSAEVYGDPWPGTLPLSENALMRPINVYGASKASADLSAFAFAHKESIHVVRARPFPHTGPGQRPNFALSSFARQLAQIKLGRAEPVVRVGNLEVKRDYSDVSDIVRGYREALLNGARSEAYNLCSGRSVEIKELLQMLIKIAEVEVEVVVDPALVRPVDIIDCYGSYQKANKDFGWKPRIDLEGTLSSLFAYWVEAVSHGE